MPRKPERDGVLVRRPQQPPSADSPEIAAVDSCNLLIAIDAVAQGFGFGFTFYQ